MDVDQENTPHESKHILDTCTDQGNWTFGSEEPKVSAMLRASFADASHAGRNLDANGQPIILTQGGVLCREKDVDIDTATPYGAYTYKDMNSLHGDGLAYERQEIDSSPNVLESRGVSVSKGVNENVGVSKDREWSEHDKFYAQGGAIADSTLGLLSLQHGTKSSLAHIKTRHIHISQSRRHMHTAAVYLRQTLDRGVHTGPTQTLYGGAHIRTLHRHVQAQSKGQSQPKTEAKPEPDTAATNSGSSIFSRLTAKIWPTGSCDESLVLYPAQPELDTKHGPSTTPGSGPQSTTNNTSGSRSSPNSAPKPTAGTTGTVSEATARVALQNRNRDASAFPSTTHTVSVWYPHGDETPTLLQVSLQDTAYLFHLAHFKSIPQALNELCLTPNILKAGHGVAADALKLYKSYGIQTCGLVEICNINQHVNVKNAYGLANAAFASTNLVLLKSKKVTMSNWEKADLSERQVYYAAQDAWIGARILDHQYRVFGEPLGLSLYQFVVKYKGLSGPSYRDVAPLGMNHFKGIDLTKCAFHPMVFKIPRTPHALQLKIVTSDHSDTATPPLGRPSYSARSDGRGAPKPRPTPVSTHRVTRKPKAKIKQSSKDWDKYTGEIVTTVNQNDPLTQEYHCLAEVKVGDDTHQALLSARI
ncbi:hypothetical protein SARC_08618 [Sphaeroforma arctica JP610]|uniref:3'-5' exonuclease domain-containing protein n=1 Tax=Sphaeroforma arctica JP610 TaxID=667725 RepID=A0A0L0FQB2_9EUKA|nr:hypothetical protein SARC_08618 [Sphaeroforma arctica JP610]KNC78972.1 hypothetical protein SARC_08618 [Sphaeroforma arctica JP610]|eukprot:XP_014152874.1 hypothetical protein SARC_08618 [Sphaeroforma arctica JP610]